MITKLRIKYAAVGLLALGAVLVSHQAFGFGFGISEQIEDMVQLFEDEAYVLDRLLVGRLEDGASSTWSFDAAHDTYIIAAVCDYDCDDVDICVSTAGDTVCDEDTDDFPLVSVRGSDLQIEVAMFNCSESYCYYGVLVFQD